MTFIIGRRPKTLFSILMSCLWIVSFVCFPMAHATIFVSNNGVTTLMPYDTNYVFQGYDKELFTIGFVSGQPFNLASCSDSTQLDRILQFTISGIASNGTGLTASAPSGSSSGLVQVWYEVNQSGTTSCNSYPCATCTISAVVADIIGGGTVALPVAGTLTPSSLFVANTAPSQAFNFPGSITINNTSLLVDGNITVGKILQNSASATLKTAGGPNDTWFPCDNGNGGVPPSTVKICVGIQSTSNTGVGNPITGSTWMQFLVDTQPPPPPTTVDAKPSYQAVNVIVTIPSDPTSGDEVAFAVGLIAPLVDNPQQDCNQLINSTEQVASIGITTPAGATMTLAVPAENGTAYMVCGGIKDFAGNQSLIAFPNIITPSDQCDFLGCYPENLHTGFFCGQSMFSIEGLGSVIAFYMLYRQRNARRRRAL